jgi:O-antigen ligase
MWPVALAAALAALWPLSAYEVNPLVLPGLIVIALAAVLVVTRPEYGLAFAIALSPLINLDVGGGSRPLQILVPFMVFGVAVYATLVLPGLRALPVRWLSLATALFVVAVIASAVQALEPSESLGKLFRVLTAGGLFFAVLEICRARRQLVIVTAGAVGALFLAGTHGVFQHFLGLSGAFSFVVDGSVVERVQGSFGHPNEFGGFVAVLIPVAGAMLATRRLPTALRAFAALSLLVGVPALTYSYARGAIGALVVGVLVWVAIVRSRFALPLAAAIAAAAVFFAPSALKERFDTSRGTDLALRSDIWGAAVDIYSERPVLGVGPNNFATAYAALPSTLADASQRRLLHQEAVLVPPYAESLYLNTLAEEGLVGLAALLLLGVSAVVVGYRGARIRDPVGRTISLGIGAGFITLAVHGIVQYTLLTEVAIPLFALLAVVARFVALDREPVEEPTEAGPGYAVRM